MSANVYQPVSCAMHSELELAIMHGRKLHIHCLDSDTAIAIKPVDIITRSLDKHNNKGEFLSGTDRTGRALEIRLDLIRKITVQ